MCFDGKFKHFVLLLEFKHNGMSSLKVINVTPYPNNTQVGFVIHECGLELVCISYFSHTKTNSVALVRTRTIPTERPPPVGEVSANFCG